MHRQVWFAASLLLMAASASAATAEAAPDPPSFFIAPITTEVQRTLAPAGSDIYAIVDCDPLLNEEPSLSAALLQAQLASQLKRFASTEADHLRLMLRYSVSPEPKVEARKGIKEKLTSLAREAGFRTVTAREMSTSVTWAEAWQRLQGFDEPAHARETVVQDRLIKAFPVRTRLSKFVLGNVDCVVEIKRPFDGRQTELSAALCHSIEKAVESMELGERKGTLLFQLSSTTAGAQPIEQLFNMRRPVTISPEITSPALRAILEKQAADYKPSPAMKLALGLGFEGIVYSHSPGGGAPEKLLGKAVPNFTLKTLQGEPLELRKYLRGRPGLVTFWGVACGPCCREAPYLTRMHGKYADRIAIVAVNGYDESKEEVTAFVEREKLAHPIVLGGGDVANQQYSVGAYPTTFWVSADGVVQDYEVGFESAEALEERIKGFIAP